MQGNIYIGPSETELLIPQHMNGWPHSDSVQMPDWQLAPGATGRGIPSSHPSKTQRNEVSYSAMQEKEDKVKFPEESVI